MGRLVFVISLILLFQTIGLGQEYNKDAPAPPPRPIVDPDSFPNNGLWNDEKLRLLEYAKEFQKQKDSEFYIIIGTKNLQSQKLKQRKSKITNYLTKRLGISKKRFEVVITESPFEETQYWIVPKKAEPPK